MAKILTQNTNLVWSRLCPLSHRLIKKTSIRIVSVRNIQFFRPTQYDMEIPRKLHPIAVLKKNWEIAPLLASVLVSMAIMVLSILWAIRHKVDVVFRDHDRNRTISRTMDLRNPTVHKIITINQEYEPWPEMQEVLDKMAKQQFFNDGGIPCE